MQKRFDFVSEKKLSKCLEFWEMKNNRENQGGTEKSVPPFSVSKSKRKGTKPWLMN